MGIAVNVVCCYAHEDEKLLNQLKTHLMPLVRQDLIAVWHDRNISAGAEWEAVIHERLEDAQIILLLISSDFMASDYCYRVEMSHALALHQQRKARVIPIILRPVHWQESPIGVLQALPIDGRPVTDGRWGNQDLAFLSVVRGVREVIRQFTDRGESHHSSELETYKVSDIRSRTHSLIQRLMKILEDMDATMLSSVDIKHIGNLVYREDFADLSTILFAELKASIHEVQLSINVKEQTIPLLEDLENEESLRLKRIEHAREAAFKLIDDFSDSTKLLIHNEVSSFLTAVAGKIDSWANRYVVKQPIKLNEIFSKKARLRVLKEINRFILDQCSQELQKWLNSVLGLLIATRWNEFIQELTRTLGDFEENDVSIIKILPLATTQAAISTATIEMTNILASISTFVEADLFGAEASVKYLGTLSINRVIKEYGGPLCQDTKTD
jgi:TIR domain